MAGRCPLCNGEHSGEAERFGLQAEGHIRIPSATAPTRSGSSATSTKSAGARIITAKAGRRNFRTMTSVRRTREIGRWGACASTTPIC
jgi:hypothetical protein